MKTKWVALFFGIVVFVLHGCTTPLVDVKVSACDQEGTPDKEAKGACFVYPAGGAPYLGDAYGFLKTTDGQFYNEHKNCKEGKKCNNFPGRCDANNHACVSWVNPVNMKCKCDCAP